MSRLQTFSKDGKKSGTITVPKALREAHPNQALLHQVVTGLLANRRRATAHTKNRGEVSGGGRKPWRQKGTGRARAGSSRSPLWRGGGTVFGPRHNRNYSQIIPVTMRRLALQQVLAEKIRRGDIFIVTALEFAKPKTHMVETWLNRLPVKEGRILLVTDQVTDELKRATANLPYLTVRSPVTINVVDLLLADSVVATKKAFDILGARYGSN